MASSHSAKDSKFALDAFKQLAPIVRKKKRGPTKLHLTPEGSKQGVEITLPQEALQGFLEILAQMANGNAVTVLPIQTELTTQQAADFLNVSRPFLISLLESNRIPFRTVGSHRRIRFSDLRSYKEADDQQRERILEELAADAQKNKHGY